MTDSVSQPSARCHVFLARAEVSITPFATGRPVGYIGIHHTGSVPNHTIVYHPITAPSHNHVGAIVGAIIGGVALLVAIAVAARITWLRRRASAGHSLPVTSTSNLTANVQPQLDGSSPTTSIRETGAPLPQQNTLAVSTPLPSIPSGRAGHYVCPFFNFGCTKCC